MKITSAHLETLRATIAPHDTDEKRADYVAAGLSTVRYQWDLVRVSGALQFVCSDLYKYLNDSHIQTALNNIVRPLA